MNPNNKAKKGQNPFLKSVINAGKKFEQNVVAANTSNEEISAVPSSGTTEIQLPEKIEDPVKVEVTIPEEDLSEKHLESKDSKKNRYTLIVQSRDKKIKESVEKTNISTDHRNLLKRLATAEGISMQDLLANIIDEFKENHSIEIKQSLKKLMS